MEQKHISKRGCPCTDRQFYFIAVTAIMISFVASSAIEWNSLIVVKVDGGRHREDLSKIHDTNSVDPNTCVVDLASMHCSKARCCQNDPAVESLVRLACCATCQNVICNNGAPQTNKAKFFVQPHTETISNDSLYVKATTTVPPTLAAQLFQTAMMVSIKNAKTEEEIELGRVWSYAKSDSAESMTATNVTRCHKGEVTPGDCELFHPIPDITSITKRSELPLYKSTCMWQFQDTQASVLELPSNRKGLLKRVSAKVGTTADACLADCLTSSQCVSWTYRTAAVSLTEKLGLTSATSSSNNEIACVLYSEFVDNPSALTSKSNNQRCTTGRVRAGRGLTDPAPNPDVDPRILKPSSDNPLRHLDLPTLGQCHDRGDCFDVHHCAARMPADQLGKVAFVFTDDLQRPASGHGRLRSLMDSPMQRRRLLAAKMHNADLVIVAPDDSVAKNPLTEQELAYFDQVRMKVVRAPWLVPPGLTSFNKGCGYMDLIRLNVWRLTDYDAVIVIDTDYTIMGDMAPIFRCAAQNYVLSTSGPLSPLNLGFVALKPSDTIIHAIEIYGANVTYNKSSGWDNAGFAPSGGQFIGAGCGQGFLWTFFYKNGDRIESEPVKIAWDQAGQARPKAYQICRCLWNYQGDRSDGCGPDFDCNNVRGMHKRIKLKRTDKDSQNGKGCFYHFWDPPK